jgi:uncharacterized membrane protein (TIGR02234 family)
VTSASPSGAPDAPRAPRRALALALASGAVGAALALVAAGRVWSSSTAPFAGKSLPVTATGGDITGLPSALALVGLAALVAVFAVRRTARVVVALLLALCGAGTVAGALLGTRDTGALQDAAAQASGLTHSGIGDVSVSAWPYVSALGGLLLLLAGLLAVWFGGRWPSMASGGSRYERPTRAPRRAARPLDPDRPEDLWQALDRGEDPTHGTP